ncbi:hypothetical protein HAX54_038511 [Datura stramonium]|uniref:G-patch domain-containing protein n=1 Tax=Datura stramonium TaxID=4076 RepID=A0ABS8VMX7_DATST|nr:hypothetical protein [Datura stramonium]
MPIRSTEAVAATSSVAPFITVQLRTPLTIQTYQPRFVLTTIISKKLDYNSKAVPWDYQEEAKTKIINTAIVHGMTRELSHPVYSSTTSPIIEELDGATFHVVEIMKVVKVRERKEFDEVKISKTTKMVASEMLKYGYQPKTGLGVKSDGIVEPIQLKHLNNTFGFGYAPILGKLCNMQLEKKVFLQEQVLVTGLEIVPKSDECIIEEMENIFIAMTEEDYGKNEVDLRMPTIRDAEPREVLQNWTTRPSLFLHES